MRRLYEKMSASDGLLQNYRFFYSEGRLARLPNVSFFFYKKKVDCVISVIIPFPYTDLSWI